MMNQVLANDLQRTLISTDTRKNARIGGFGAKPGTRQSTEWLKKKYNEANGSASSLLQMQYLHMNMKMRSYTFR